MSTKQKEPNFDDSINEYEVKALKWLCYDGAETNCRIAHILGILLMNSCNTDIFSSNYYHLQSVRFELWFIPNLTETQELLSKYWNIFAGKARIFLLYEWVHSRSPGRTLYN